MKKRGGGWGGGGGGDDGKGEGEKQKGKEPSLHCAQLPAAVQRATEAVQLGQ